MAELERIFLWSIRIGALLLLFVPLVVSHGMLFPFITGKNFFFRIVVEVMTAAWLSLAVLNRSYRPRLSVLAVALGAFVTIVGIATLTGVDPFNSFWSNFERMEGLITYIHLGALFLILGSTFRTQHEWAYLFHGSLAVSVIVTFYALLQARGIVSIVGEYRPYAWFGNSIYLAEYLMVHLFIAFFFLLRAKEQWQRVCYGAVAALEWYVFLVAASRGAFVGFVGGVAITLTGLFFVSSLRRTRLVALLLVSFLVLSGIVIFLVPNNFFVRNIEVLSRLEAVSPDAIKEDPRILMWRIGWRAFMERPLLGWGPGNFTVPYARFYDPRLHGNEPWFDRVHNVFLEWLVATGILGFLAYVGVYGAAFYLLFRLVRRGRIEVLLGVFLAGAFGAYLIQNVFVFDTLVTYIILIAWFAFLHAMGVPPEGELRKGRKFDLFRGSIIIGVWLSCCVVVYMLNVPAMRAARGTLGALQQFGENAPPEIVRQSMLSVERLDTFGTQELYERIGNEVALAITSSSAHAELSKALLDDAIRGFEQEVLRQPHDAKSTLFLARLYGLRFSLKKEPTDFQNTERAYMRSLELAPRYVQGRIGLAELYLSAGKMDEARRTIDEAFEMAPQSEEMVSASVAVHLIANDPDGALHTIESYMGIHRKQKDMTNFGADEIVRKVHLAEYVQDTGRRTAFLEEYARWAKPHAALYATLARLYKERGEDVKAHQAALRALELDVSFASDIAPFLSPGDW